MITTVALLLTIRTSKSWPFNFFRLLQFHTSFAGSDRDIKFSKIVCSILYNKDLLLFKIMSSSNGNVSETSKKTETFTGSKDWRWIESPSSEDEYDPDG